MLRGESAITALIAQPLPVNRDLKASLRKVKGPDARGRVPALSCASLPRTPRYCTPLSLGVAKASLIACVSGKFRLMPLGGIGLVNHLA